MHLKSNYLLIVTLVGMLVVGIVAHRDFVHNARAEHGFGQGGAALQTTLQRSAHHLTEEQVELWRLSFRTTPLPVFVTGRSTY